MLTRDIKKRQEMRDMEDLTSFTNFLGFGKKYESNIKSIKEDDYYKGIPGGIMGSIYDIWEGLWNVSVYTADGNDSYDLEEIKYWIGLLKQVDLRFKELTQKGTLERVYPNRDIIKDDAYDSRNSWLKEIYNDNTKYIGKSNLTESNRKELQLFNTNMFNMILKIRKTIRDSISEVK